MPRILATLMLLMTFASNTYAEQVRIAVASNFKHTLDILTQHFEQSTGYQTKVSSASSGKLFAQIVQGAPFDIFLSADKLRPVQLEKRGLVIPGSRFTYAQGKLAVYYPAHDGSIAPKNWLSQPETRVLALANPKTAPYGAAAKQAMEQIGWWQKVRMVRGESVSQALQFLLSGNAQIGFVSYAQLKAAKSLNQKGIWLLDENLYSPIEQQAVQISETPGARQFMAYLKHPQTKSLIEQRGYGVSP